MSNQQGVAEPVHFEHDGHVARITLNRPAVHNCLDTATHADHGLMRAAIDAREFADPDARTFGLDGTAGAWLKGHLRATAGNASSPAPFRYTQN